MRFYYSSLLPFILNKLNGYFVCKISVFILLIICVLGCRESQSSDKISIERSKKIIVAMDLSFPPYQGIGMNGKPHGILVDLIYDLGAFLGKSIEIIPTQWNATLAGIQSGKYDLATFATITPERAKVIDFSMPYMHMGLDFIIRKGLKFKDKEDFNDAKIRIAVQQGTIAEIVARQYFSKAILIRLNDIDTTVFDVIQGKADITMHYSLAVHQITQKYPHKVLAYYSSLAVLPRAFAMRKTKDKILMYAVNAFLKDYKVSGKMSALADKHLADIKAEFEKQGNSLGVSFE